ncbi:hypothetical protein KHM83_16465 [Fusibacter paucivorans]|uniref:DUF4407 domain-containing protein n=1 Tax=Fusibacter paucivorans TaxID=76009 RepID=A0ABS5PSY9_9FIRM|nr:hypothetical protein [Fusibacter paucivorans]MBS7528284.1 hypothetical protein [Fusibacter paucivorans]
MRRRLMDISPILFFAKFIKLGIWVILLVCGIAAFLISVSTTVFVVDSIFPNTYIPLLAGIALDLAKISSIFIERFTKQMDGAMQFISVVWRLFLVGIAALFTCITISGVMLNQNVDEILAESQVLAKDQYENAVKLENDSYLDQYNQLEEEKEKERVTGIGERYMQLLAEQSALVSAHNERLDALNSDYEATLDSLSKDTFEGNIHKNVALFENFKETINMSFNVETTYSWWVLVLVGLIALVLELTMYVLFNHIAGALVPFVIPLQEIAKEDLEYRIEMKKNRLDFRRAMDMIKYDSDLKMFEQAVEADVVEDKYENYTLKTERDMHKFRDEIEKDLDRNLITDIVTILDDFKSRKLKKDS